MTTSARVLTVRFTDPAEYLDELERDTFIVERKIVRLRALAVPAMRGTYHLAVVRSGYVVEGRPVTLEATVGSLWGHHDDEKVRTRAAELVERIRVAIDTHGLELRAGELAIATADVEATE